MIVYCYWEWIITQVRILIVYAIDNLDMITIFVGTSMYSNRSKLRYGRHRGITRAAVCCPYLTDIPHHRIARSKLDELTLLP